jgi:hypothetical protein
MEPEVQRLWQWREGEVSGFGSRFVSHQKSKCSRADPRHRAGVVAGTPTRRSLTRTPSASALPIDEGLQAVSAAEGMLQQGVDTEVRQE